MSISDEIYGEVNPAIVRPVFKRTALRHVKAGEIYWYAPNNNVECDTSDFNVAYRQLALASLCQVALCDFSSDAEFTATSPDASPEDLAYFDHEVTVLTFVPTDSGKETLQ